MDLFYGKPPPCRTNNPVFYYREIHSNYGSREKGFKNIEEMFFVNNELYWSSNEDGLDVEVKHKGEFYYNTIESDLQMDAMTVVHPTVQPIPVPVNNVQDLQLVFGHRKGAFCEVKLQFLLSMKCSL